MNGLCCIMRDNTNLKNVIEEQTRTIGELINEKNNIKLQFENLIDWVGSNMILNHSNIDNPVEQAEQAELTSNIVDSSNVEILTSNIIIE